jgi:two-component sensor histidine kinase
LAKTGMLQKMLTKWLGITDLITEIQNHQTGISQNQENITEILEQTNKRLDALAQKQRKMLACDKGVPLIERVTEGLEYIEHGGNGEIRLKVSVLMEKLKKQQEEAEKKEAT